MPRRLRNRATGDHTRLSRRRFLAAAGAGLAVPAVIPAACVGADGKVAPSNRVGVGMIGLGRFIATHSQHENEACGDTLSDTGHGSLIAGARCLAFQPYPAPRKRAAPPFSLSIVLEILGGVEKLLTSPIGLLKINILGSGQSRSGRSREA